MEGLEDEADGLAPQPRSARLVETGQGIRDRLVKDRHLGDVRIVPTLLASTA